MLSGWNESRTSGSSVGGSKGVCPSHLAADDVLHSHKGKARAIRARQPQRIAVLHSSASLSPSVCVCPSHAIVIFRMQCNSFWKYIAALGWCYRKHLNAHSGLEWHPCMLRQCPAQNITCRNAKVEGAKGAVQYMDVSGTFVSLETLMSTSTLSSRGCQ